MEFHSNMTWNLITKCKRQNNIERESNINKYIYKLIDSKRLDYNTFFFLIPTLHLLLTVLFLAILVEFA